MPENLGVISDIKQCLLEDILTDEKAVKLITNQAETTLPAMGLRYKQVVPWQKAIGIVEEAKTFVTFEVSIPTFVTDATKLFRLSVHVITHEDLMKVDNAVGKQLEIDDRGDRIDILADRIDYLINGASNYTFDRLKFVSSNVFLVGQSFHGRTMVYEMRGWNRCGDRI